MEQTIVVEWPQFVGPHAGWWQLHGWFCVNDDDDDGGQACGKGSLSSALEGHGNTVVVTKREKLVLKRHLMVKRNKCAVCHQCNV